MKFARPVLAIGVVLVAAPLLLAQDETGEAASLQKVKDEMRRRVVEALGLPEAAQQAREEGVPEEDVDTVLEEARQRRVPAGELKMVLEEETRSAAEHGRLDNFGAFVKSKLAEGLRGRELADAIHAEHAARGIGKGRGKAVGRSRPGKSGREHPAGDDEDHVAEREDDRGSAEQSDDDPPREPRGKSGSKQDRGKRADRTRPDRDR